MWYRYTEKSQILYKQTSDYITSTAAFCSVVMTPLVSNCSNNSSTSFWFWTGSITSFCDLDISCWQNSNNKSNSVPQKTVPHIFATSLVSVHRFQRSLHRYNQKWSAQISGLKSATSPKLYCRTTWQNNSAYYCRLFSSQLRQVCANCSQSLKKGHVMTESNGMTYNGKDRKSVV